VSTVTKAARNSLLWLLAIIVALGGGVAWQAIVDKHSWKPELGLDLAGGRVIILQAKTLDGSAVTADSLKQSVEIIRRRVDASGVAEATITTENADQIVVSLPGNPSEEDVAAVKRSAQLQFRPVLFYDDGTTTTFPTLTEDHPEFAGTGSSYSWITDAVKTEFLALDCTNAAALLGGDPGNQAAAFVTCGTETPTARRYLLGPVEVQGIDVKTASASPASDSTGSVIPNEYQVNLTFTGSGTTKFADVTTRLAPLYSAANTTASMRNQFAIVLDGLVISAPRTESVIAAGTARISGSFTTMEPAKILADQIKFGALPLTLTTLSQSKTTATQGETELKGGLIAGAIGLALVVLYSLMQYRVLGLITVASLGIAGTVTFGSIDYLSGLIGYRLSLAGIAGIIVSIGMTADSFIVYFERVRDELRDGRTLPAAVEHGWARARRTILASDSVSFLAAMVLYLTAVGNVKGFAFTLGLTTIVDLVVVMLFTHPMLGILARTKFFGQGHVLSGLDPRQLGRESFYKGRGRVAVAEMTLAERKAAEMASTPAAQKGQS
jgi:preprotein translocase subunit SecD